MKKFRPALIVITSLLWTILSILIPQILLSIILSFLSKESLSNTGITTFYNILSYSLSIFFLLFIPWKLFKKWKPSREELGLKKLPTFSDIGLAMPGFVAYFFLAQILTKVFSLFPWFNAEESQNIGFDSFLSTPDKIFAFISLVIIAPIAEELIFRGWLYGKLRSKISSKLSLPISIVLVSILFGLLHGQWNVAVNVFALSVIMCLMREITGTIYSSIFLHIIKNAIAFYFMYIVIAGQ